MTGTAKMGEGAEGILVISYLHFPLVGATWSRVGVGGACAREEEGRCVTLSVSPMSSVTLAKPLSFCELS